MALPCLTAYAQVTDTTKADTAQKDTARNILVLPDTVPHLKSKFLSFIPPTAFVTYGLLSFKIKAIRNVDFSVYRDMEDDHPNYNTDVDDYLQYAPVISVYALNFAGVRGKNTFIDRTILFALSELIFAGVTNTLKYSSDRLRPDGSNRYSFPSGHTGNAFTSAEFMAQEFAERSPLYGAAGYAMATTTAILRVYNNKHWFSDIVAGAGFGILSVKAAYLIYPLFRNRLFHDKDKTEKSAKSNMIFMPSYQNGGLGFAFVKSF